jgi:hypothetical protein
MLLLAVSASACAEWSDPAAFDEEREALQNEWKGACGDPCSTVDAPAACGIEGDAMSCAGYSEANATACISLYKKVIRRDICSATDKDMINLGEACNAVYVNCGGETDTGDTGDTGTEDGTDTGGETDTGATG